MLLAREEAARGVMAGHGGPFGAVIVCHNQIIARAHNEVPHLQDPTAHAEMQAIRKAARKLGRFDLSDCAMYITCEPCPMCLAAIHWAKMKKVFFGATRADAARIGFADKYIYDVMQGKRVKQQVISKQLNRKECLEEFKAWENKRDKNRY